MFKEPILFLFILLFSIRFVRSYDEKTRFYFIFGSDCMKQSYAISSFKDIFDHPQFFKNRSTVLYIHGTNDGLDKFSPMYIAKAYLARKDHNVIIFNWQKEATCGQKDGFLNYFGIGVPNAVELGRLLGQSIAQALTEEIADKFYIIGHSLGAQMAGYIGRTVMKKAKNRIKIKRICGLDPSYPGFYPNVITHHLNSEDAEFVDVIHSDAGILGIPVSIGHVDFWPNNGSHFQPGCPVCDVTQVIPNLFCSHIRSINYFVESLLSRGKRFLAVKAKSWPDFVEYKTDNDDVVEMGVDCPRTARGDYFLQTEAKAPFARAKDGIHWILAKI